jgi:colicin import membrane protein
LRQDQTDKTLYQFPSDKGKGLVGTILFHVVVIVVLVLAGFTSTPVTIEEGLLVNFGTEEFGSGLIEPSEGSVQLPSTLPPSQSTALPTQSQEEKINTQEFDEEAPVVKKVINDPELEKKRLDEIEANKKLKAEQEAERKRLEQEELERKRKEEELRKSQEATDRVANALAAGRNTGTTSTGGGVTTGTGNQGVVTGSVDSKIRGDGSGLGTDGTSYNLAGRKALALPEPKYEYQVEGSVVVEIRVDSQGKVTSATAGVKGSTTLDANLLRVAREAALLAKFDPKTDQIAQVGTITYIFKLK